jgi:hypothetical protein
VILNRVFDPPSTATFRIASVAALLRRYVKTSEVWADPFAGWNSPATITNDLNPEAPTTFHLDAEQFCQQLADDSLDGVLFDPPYSPRQMSEAYRGVGRTPHMKDTQNGLLYATVRDSLIPKLKRTATVISFGWNTTGFGLARGFLPIEYLFINHGAAHNDTLVVVEKRDDRQNPLFGIEPAEPR